MRTLSLQGGKKLRASKRKKISFALFDLMLPVSVWLILFLIAPYLNLFMYSFWKNDTFSVIHQFNLGNYVRFFVKSDAGDAPYLILLDTLKTALCVTVISVLISFPLAYFINFRVKKYKQLFYMLAIIPMWVSYILRAYSWKIILGQNGILNSFLMFTGLTKAPLSFFLYSNVSIIIAMVHIYTPFVMMPIFTSLEQIPRSLVEASKDLGSGKIRTFMKIVLPLSVPGIITGATYSFTLSMGDFLAPSLLGGSTSSTKIANIVQMQFGTSNDWPYGAAIGIIILLLVLVLLEVTNRIGRHFSKLEETEA